MITVISGTNRPDSHTLSVARHILTSLRDKEGEEVKLLDLAALDHAFFSTAMYEADGPPTELRRLQEELILAADKLVFVAPEYNGSIPGALKVFIDAISVHRYRENFFGKPVILIGTATGRAGNLRGMDHLAQILLHMGAQLHLDKLPLSRVDTLLNEEGKLVDEDARVAIAKQTDYLSRI